MTMLNGFLPTILRAPDDGTGAAPPVPDAAASMSAREAVVALQAAREKPNTPADDAPDAVEPGQPDSAEADAAPPETETSGETEQADEPADVPPLDPPRSWTKEDKAIFPSLPRETQQRLLELDRTRELEVRNGQNQVAEQRRAAEAARVAADNERQRYEAELPNLLQSIQRFAANEFADIKSADDVRRMAAEDPARYIQYDALQKEYARAAAMQQQAVARQESDQAKAFEAFRTEQTKLFLEKAPEYADAAKASQLQTEARALFDDVGLTSAEFDALAAGKSGISIHDHRVQLIVRDALRYRAAERAVKTAPAKPVPPVQRPGTAALKGDRQAANVETLRNNLRRTGSVKDAAALLRAQRG